MSILELQGARYELAEYRKQLNAGMSEPEVVEISAHETETGAREAGHAFLSEIGLPSGWALAILGNDAYGWRLVRYER